MSNKSLALGAVWGGAGLGLAAGTQIDGGLSQALVLVAGAGGLLLLVLGVNGRRILGGLLALAAGGMIITGMTQAQPLGYAWPLIFAGAGLLVGSGALLTIITSSRWPARPGPYPRGRPADDETALWQALDAGIDPTVDAEHDDPDVHIRPSPDTMGNADQSQRSSRRE